jgi:hypothetical protein
MSYLIKINNFLNPVQTRLKSLRERVEVYGQVHSAKYPPLPVHS